MIAQFFTAQDWHGLTAHLSRLSNADFRKAEKHIRESILPSVPSNVFWQALLNLIIFKKAAFITGMLALKSQLKTDTNTIESKDARDFGSKIAAQCPDSVPKLLNIALPMLQTEKQISSLFSIFAVHDERQQIAALLKIESPLTYFVLFKTLKMIPDNQDIVRKSCIYIMKRNNDISYNMVSILKAYFGIDEMKSQLALRLDTYELSYLDRNYDTFLHILNGKRPRI